MTDRQTLSDLLEKVRACEGADRELDSAIEVAIRWIEAARYGIKPEHRASWRASAGGYVEDPHTRYESARVTASLDAALALAERVLTKGGRPALQQASDGTWSASVGVQGGGRVCGLAAPTPALALLAALLTALLAEEAGK